MPDQQGSKGILGPFSEADENTGLRYGNLIQGILETLFKIYSKKLTFHETGPKPKKSHTDLTVPLVFEHSSSKALGREVSYLLLYVLYSIPNQCH